ncbi:MAG: FHA domain-containing protein, partial [Blastocatellia bacterium]|nr:FHA domain-containing protein [Blastocatellia bacterium]
LSKEDDALWQGRKRDGLEEGLRTGLTQRARELVGDRVLNTEKVALSLGVDGSLNKGRVRVQAVWDDDSPRTEVTIRKPKVSVPAGPAAQEAAADAGEMTVIRPRAPLFAISYTRGGGEPIVYNSYRTKVEIGRGSKDFPVDLKIEGDPEISRKQAIIEKLESGSYKIECVGRNSIEIDGRELQPGEQLELSPGQVVRIGVYELKVVGGNR